MLRWKGLIDQAIKFIYPPLCYSCEQATEGELLCSFCADLLEPFSFEGRCRTCTRSGECFCFLTKPTHSFAAAAFISEGPILDLAKEESLARPLAALAYHAYLQLHLPPPESILPAKDPLFGKALAKWFQVPLGGPNPLITALHFHESLSTAHPSQNLFTLLA